MKTDSALYFKTLFDPEDLVCFGTTAKDTRLYKQDDAVGYTAQYVSINALDVVDHNPTEEYHAEWLPRRADHNVTKLRNFLIEFDTMLIDEQKRLVRELQMPYSTCVWSGSKSLHFIISLKTPLSTKQEYEDMKERLYKVVGKKNLDRACGNPSRFSRNPNVVRPSNGNVQHLLKVNGRIDNNVLELWLLKMGIMSPDVLMVPPRPRREPSQDARGYRLSTNPSARLICPSCGGGHDGKTFTPFLATDTMEIIPGAGMCGRANKCGIKVTPKQAQPDTKWYYEKR